MDSPWRLIPAHEARPVGPGAEARARGWFRELLAGLRSDAPAPTVRAPDEARLGPVEEARLRRIAPEPPRNPQRAALDALRGRTRSAILLRPDDGGWDAVLDDAGPGVTVVAPPDAPPLGDALPPALRDLLQSEATLHLARIERWGVRHHDGLATLRDLAAALAARPAPWTADVGPWAWAWMRRVLPEARALPGAWVPAPLDGETLAAWLGGAEGLRARGSGEAPTAATFHQLAVTARGEAGAALAIWRACLRDGQERRGDAAEPGRDGASNGRTDAEAEAEAEAEAAPGPTVWLRSPTAVDLPSATGATRHELLALHAVLLGANPTRDTVARSLGTEARPGMAALAAAEARGLVTSAGGDRIRVAPTALPSVTLRLEAEAFAGSAA